MIRALDLFCGAGGSSYGAVCAGAELVGAVDAWDVAARTIALNHPGAEVVNERLHSESRPSFRKSLGDIDLLLASPECTNHSVAKGNKERCDESRRSANYVLHYVRDLAPKWVVIENVIQMRGWDGYEAFTKTLEKMGYGIREQVLDANDFGVPQTRRRLFVMCERGRIPAALPISSPTKRKSALSALKLDKDWPSRPLFRPGRAEATLARAQRAMESLGRGVPFLIVYYGSDGAGGWQPLTRPLRTLTTLDRFGLVTWHGRTPYLRMLQVPELKAAMGFPASYQLEGTRRDQIKLLGNGVCPPVMKAVVSHLSSPSSSPANELQSKILVPLRISSSVAEEELIS